MRGTLDLVTADFTYVRWLGNRKGIEEQTTTWDKTVIDRKDDLRSWVVVLRRLVEDKRIRKHLCVCEQPLCGVCTGDRLSPLKSLQGLLLAPATETSRRTVIT